MSHENTRVAIIDKDKCKPKNCRQECKKKCPVVALGKLCIEVNPISKIATISEIKETIIHLKRLFFWRRMV